MRTLSEISLCFLGEVSEVSSDNFGLHSIEDVVDDVLDQQGQLLRAVQIQPTEDLLSELLLLGGLVLLLPELEDAAASFLQANYCEFRAQKQQALDGLLALDAVERLPGYQAGNQNLLVLAR